MLPSLFALPRMQSRRLGEEAESQRTQGQEPKAKEKRVERSQRTSEEWNLVTEKGVYTLILNTLFWPSVGFWAEAGPQG